MRALILGIGGQDGSYLADILLDRGYEVHGLYRRSSVNNLQRIEHIRDKVALHQGDITDPPSILQTMRNAMPIDEVYNMADQDHVGWSCKSPGYSFDVTAKAVATTLDIVRQWKASIKFFQPCSATMFGNVPPLQDENTPHNPQSPYACAKTAAYHIARYYRQVYGMFVSTAILYNHHSPRRSGNYLLHQICKNAWKVATTEETEIRVGDPGMLVDIGYAEEYMSGVVDIMQLEKPMDLILASDYPFTIKHIIEHTMNLLECKDYTIVADDSLLRPGLQPRLIGDISKAKREINFSPKTSALQQVGWSIASRLLAEEHLTEEERD